MNQSNKLNLFFLPYKTPHGKRRKNRKENVHKSFSLTVQCFCLLSSLQQSEKSALCTEIFKLAAYVHRPPPEKTAKPATKSLREAGKVPLESTRSKVARPGVTNRKRKGDFCVCVFWGGIVRFVPGRSLHLGDRSWRDVKGELLEDDGDTPSIFPGEPADEPRLLRLPSNSSGE